MELGTFRILPCEWTGGVNVNITFLPAALLFIAAILIKGRAKCWIIEFSSLLKSRCSLELGRKFADVFTKSFTLIG